ncbi:MAG: DUF2817 domain-containing protein [Alphaproteobacteria bacterium]|nr:DUF2817 domain-containing protein [Alphaproteobacteria bacterium]
MTDTPDSPFSGSYAGARDRFRAACGAAGIPVKSYENPRRGPEGEALAMDAAWFGPQDASRALVTISATHGAEGFCGSAVQLDWIARRGRSLQGGDLAVLHLHALNPHGFAWLRRVNEDGVDLNRNFVDFAAPLPANPGYDELHAALLPASLDPSALAAAEAVIEAYRVRHGQRALEMAVSSGQYTQPAGLFYGGAAPAWSRRAVEAVLTDFGLVRRRVVAVVDIHTGLGPFGYGEIICDHPAGSAETLRGRRWYGASMTEPALGTSTSVAKYGLLDYGWQRALGPAVTFVTLEFGTYPVEDMFRQLRLDHILHRDGAPDWGSPETQAAKATLKRHFFPDTAEWRSMVLARGREVLGQAEDGLRGEP